MQATHARAGHSAQPKRMLSPRWFGLHERMCDFDCLASSRRDSRRDDRRWTGELVFADDISGTAAHIQVGLAAEHCDSSTRHTRAAQYVEQGQARQAADSGKLAAADCGALDNAHLAEARQAAHSRGTSIVDLFASV